MGLDIGFDCLLQDTCFNLSPSKKCNLLCFHFKQPLKDNPFMFKVLFVLYLQAKKSYERALKLENEFGEYFTAVVQVQFAFNWG